MKKSLSLVFAALLFVALGCSFAGLGKKEEAPTPVPETKSSDTSKAPDKTGDSSSTSSGAGDLTLDKFNQMKLGMSYEDVAKTLGSEGSETSSSSIGKYELKSFKWEGSNRVRIYGNFRNNELTAKNQGGLRGEAADVTKAKYDEIKTGMSYEDVKNVIGSEGTLTRISKIGNSESSSYRWRGDGSSSLTVSFSKGKMRNKSQFGLK